jgi:N-acetylglucosamine kinase-like BadF-type ATPase
VINKKSQPTEGDDAVIVGIDIGGTKTHVRVATDDGDLDVVVPTVSWNPSGSLSEPANVEHLLATFIEHLQVPAHTPLVVGAHGCDTPVQIADFAAALRAQYPGPIEVRNDAQLLGPAAGRADAIALIAGTGSIVIGENENGEAITAGGHGWMLADPGSAPALAREGVRALLERFDSGHGNDALATLFLEHMRVSSINDLSYAFIRNASMQAWAEMAPLVFTAADAGSEAAVRVIDEAGQALAASVKNVIDRGARASAVIASGGVVTNQRRLQDSITRHVHGHFPTLSVEVLRDAPVAGAIVLGRSLQSNHSYTNQSGG